LYFPVNANRLAIQPPAVCRMKCLRSMTTGMAYV
jgi:hypothetical protein